jgi:uncharacterized repeat protein (TIGR03803 family)
MNYKKFLGAASATLMIVIVVTLVLAPGAWAQGKYKTLYKFKGGKDGNGPWAGLIFDAAGNLYGTTLYGGAHKVGTVFELSPGATGGWTESVLYSFTGGADGRMSGSGAGLVFDGAGNLYGTAGAGGAYGQGVAFELTPTSSGWAESVLYSFTGGADGGGPYAGLIFDTAGNLYSTTWGGGRPDCGCGVVFKLAPTSSGWNESVLYSFGPDGQNSDAELMFDGAGLLYGVAWYGGTYGNGNVFKLTPTSSGEWTESALHQFKGDKDGAHPRAGLIFDSVGNLYGTAANEYTSGYGIVLKLVPNSDGSWTKQTLHQFTGGKDGANPYVAVTFDSAGNLYGATNDGGAYGYGVVFKLTPTSTGGWTYRVLHGFRDAPGADPRGDLVVDGSGNIYGTTYGDGSKTFGSVFEITP